jgi:hypothetical protein
VAGFRQLMVPGLQQTDIGVLCEEEGADRDPIAESDSVVFAYLFYLRVLYAYYIGYSSLAYNIIRPAVVQISY